MEEAFRQATTSEVTLISLGHWTCEGGTLSCGGLFSLRCLQHSLEHTPDDVLSDIIAENALTWDFSTDEQHYYVLQPTRLQRRLKDSTWADCTSIHFWAYPKIGSILITTQL